ncbi:hypothetical protein D5086_032530 [Populus alba]|uniref:Uncharacterized protein n=1 Tax=Populus alba TaxID=43335 RepID=A0ACC4ALM6_POPAL
MPAGVAVIPLALRVHNRDHWFYLALGKIKAMAFDKTGTITRGEFVVTDFHHLGEDLEELQNFPGEGIQGKNEVKNICIDNRKIAHRASGTVGKNRDIEKTERLVAFLQRMGTSTTPHHQIPYIESGTYVDYNDENGGLAPRMDINESNGSKPKKQPKRERTGEEKTFRRRARYFLVTQVVAVLVFLSVMSSNDFSEVEVDDDEDEDEGFSYD